MIVENTQTNNTNKTNGADRTPNTTQASETLPGSSLNIGGLGTSVVNKESTFRKSSMMHRTPTKDTVNEVQQIVASTNPGQILPEGFMQKEEIELNKINGIIAKMKNATKRQTNISNDVKTGLAELEEVFSAITFFRGKWRIMDPTAQINQSAPVSVQDKNPINRPIVPAMHVRSESTKRAATSPADENEGKKTRGETPTGIWHTQESRHTRRRRILQAKVPQVDKVDEASAEIGITPAQRKKRRSKKTRPEALRIRPAQGQTYAGILREIRSGAKPEESAAEVIAIRQTRAGDVLLELGPRTKNKEAFCEALKNVLGEKGKVHTLESKIQLKISDIDACTEKEEVETAIRRDIPDAGDINISIFPVGREQKVAVVRMDGRSASNLLKQGRIKIGWLYCRVRERAVVERCFRCFGYGHIAMACKGVDRSNFCYKCFGAGHKARLCTAQEHRCELCLEKGVNQEGLGHIPGSGKCQVFREALQAVRKRL